MNASLEAKIAALKVLLVHIEQNFAPAVFASSFGAEDMVLFDLIARHGKGIEIFTLDTGRLPSETLNLMHRAQAKYPIGGDFYEIEDGGNVLKQAAIKCFVV